MAPNQPSRAELDNALREVYRRVIAAKQAAEVLKTWLDAITDGELQNANPDTGVAYAYSAGDVANIKTAAANMVTMLAGGEYTFIRRVVGLNL